MSALRSVHQLLVGARGADLGVDGRVVHEDRDVVPAVVAVRARHQDGLEDALDGQVALDLEGLAVGRLDQEARVGTALGAAKEDHGSSPGRKWLYAKA